MLFALAGVLALFVESRMLSAVPHINAEWRNDTQGRVELVSSPLAGIRSLEGQKLVGIGNGAEQFIPAPTLLVQRSERWVTDDGERSRLMGMRTRISSLLKTGTVHLIFDDGVGIEVQPGPRRLTDLGIMYWLLSGVALVLYVAAFSVFLARPSLTNGLFAVIALSQGVGLHALAIETAFAFGLPSFLDWLSCARMACDVATGAAIANTAVLHPKRLPIARIYSIGTWAVVAAAFIAFLTGHLPNVWWWAQGISITFGLVTIVLLTWSYRLVPHPFALIMRRFAVVTTGTWMLLTAAYAANSQVGLEQSVATIGSIIWYLFLASLILVVPFLSRSQQLLREFSMLAAITTVATSLDLLFVAVFSLEQFTSLTLALFIAFGAYAGIRRWILDQALGSRVVSAERIVDLLYGVVRDAERYPQEAPKLLARMLRDIFEPLEVSEVERTTDTVRSVAEGSTLIVPIPHLSPRAESRLTSRSIVLRFAQRGRRLFSSDDVRLAERIVEQLQRALAYEKAVEHGRSQERTRLAQDLHDDIGARLLTLMYRAPNPETEEYVRHTLQDLKTLTRGLAATSHRLSDAIGEWKADITQRLALVGCELTWASHIDNDFDLGVVQWSALTRVLRELVSNISAHARATGVDITLRLQAGEFTLQVIDNGTGRHPEHWAHGLGLGGVRKRVKQLGGSVEWQQNPGAGITCRVMIAGFSGTG